MAKESRLKKSLDQVLLAKYQKIGVRYEGSLKNQAQDVIY